MSTAVEGVALVRPSRLPVAIVLAALLGAPADVSARVARVRCVDGLLSMLGRLGPRYCDVDEKTDGVCTFVLPRCDSEVACSSEIVTLPVRLRRVVRVRECGGVTTFTLSCRLPVPCDEEHHCTPVTRTCEDGVLGPMQEGQCGLDQQANGTCTFGFFCLEVCGRLVESVAVPVGQARIVERPNLPLITVTQYTLRCLRSP